MKKINFNKRKIFFGILQLVIVGVLCLGFFKYSEEITSLKEKVRQKIYFSQKETNVDFSDYPAIEHVSDAWYMRTPLIYHGGGGIDGLAYTNSKEALETTLGFGARFVEIDFLYTSDQHLVCGHYWDSLWEEGVPTLAQFKELPIFGKYSSLTAEELIDYMVEYPDLQVVVDTKEENFEGVIKDLVQLSSFDTSVTDRFIIQLYEPGIKSKVQEIYPFADEMFLFTTYKFGSEFTNRIMKLCYDENISVIAVPDDAWEEETIAKFNEKNFVIYEYTVNRPHWARQSMEDGIHGFYTDFLRKSDLQP